MVADLASDIMVADLASSDAIASNTRKIITLYHVRFRIPMKRSLKAEKVSY